MPASRRAQSWRVCVWIRPVTIGYDYRGCARGRRKSARRVNGLGVGKFEPESSQKMWKQKSSDCCVYVQYSYLCNRRLPVAGQPGVARAFALRAELCSSFLASRSLNPEMSGSPMKRFAFLWNVLALTKRPFWIEENAPVEHHCSHCTESVTYHDIRSNESWRITKSVRRKENFLKKSPSKDSHDQVQWLASTRTLAAGHGSKEWACLCTWHRVFSMN